MLLSPAPSACHGCLTLAWPGSSEACFSPVVPLPQHLALGGVTVKGGGMMACLVPLVPWKLRQVMSREHLVTPGGTITRPPFLVRASDPGWQERPEEHPREERGCWGGQGPWEECSSRAAGEQGGPPQEEGPRSRLVPFQAWNQQAWQREKRRPSLWGGGGLQADAAEAAGPLQLALRSGRKNRGSASGTLPEWLPWEEVAAAGLHLTLSRDGSQH